MENSEVPSSGEPIRVRRDGPVASVTLDRPRVLNAWNAAMRHAFIAALEELNGDADVRALVLTGAGDRAFSAGEDFNEARALDAAGSSDLMDELNALYTAIVRMDKPLVAALNGAAMGLGLQVALLCDLRVAHEQASLAQPEVTVGIPSVLGPRIIEMLAGRAAAVDMAFTGRAVRGEEALRLGLISQLVAPEDVLATAERRARELAQAPPVATRLTRRRFAELTLPVLEDAFAAAARAQREAYESGEPQRMMERFLAQRRKQKGGAAQ